MDINYNNKYAYAEVYAILDWLGDDYKRKVPKNLLRLFKDERKFGYRPEIDFTKPLGDQVRQETKNIIAYLNYSCWLEDAKKKEELRQAIAINAAAREEREKAQKMKEKMIRQQSGNKPLNAVIDEAIKDLKNQ